MFSRDWLHSQQVGLSRGVIVVVNNSVVISRRVLVILLARFSKKRRPVIADFSALVPVVELNINNYRY